MPDGPPDNLDTLDLRLAPQKVDAIHRAVLSGLLGNIATRSTGGDNPNEYTAARGARASIFPGSGQFKRKPAWIMAAEVVETTRLYARTVAPIQPQWGERLGQHLVKRTWTEPHFQAPPNPSAQVVAFEKVTLFGLTLVPRRSVHYGPIDPEVSRQLFIHHALVLGEFRTSGEFFAHNRKLIEEIRILEAKRRQRDLLVEEQAIYDFYDRRIPAGIYNGPLFEKWRQHVERGRPTLLFLHRRDLLKHEVEDNKADYPDHLRLGDNLPLGDHVRWGDNLRLGSHRSGNPPHLGDDPVPPATPAPPSSPSAATDAAEAALPLSYVFDPSDPNDGVTVTVPLALLNQIPAAKLEWLVPGLLREKVIGLMKTMPKPLRVKFVPVPEHADRALAMLATLRAKPRFRDAGLRDALAHALGKLSGEPMDRRAFAPQELSPHLLMNVRVIDDAGEEVTTGRDLDALRRKLGVAARKAFAQASAAAARAGAGRLNAAAVAAIDPSDPALHFHRDGITSWDDTLILPDHVEIRRNGMTLLGYPALTAPAAPAGSPVTASAASADAVSLRLFDSPEAARTAQRGGVRRLLMLQLREEVKYLQRRLPSADRICLNYATVGKCETLKADLVDAVVDRALYMPEGDECHIRTREQFLARAQHGWRRMSVAANELTALVADILEKYQALHLDLSKVAAPALIASYQDMRRHLSSLVYDGFVRRTPAAWLAHYPRFLDALRSRLRKLHSAGLARDLAAMREIAPLEERLKAAAGAAPWTMGSAPEADADDADAPGGARRVELSRFRWMVEELRVSLFAQELKTSMPVSVKRLEAQWEKVEALSG